jgi:hypothetical protein
MVYYVFIHAEPPKKIQDKKVRTFVVFTIKVKTIKVTSRTVSVALSCLASTAGTAV